MLRLEVVCKALDLVVVTDDGVDRLEVEVLRRLEVGVDIEERVEVQPDRKVRMGLLLVVGHIAAVIVEQLVEEQEEVELVGLIGIRLLELERQYR